MAARLAKDRAGAEPPAGRAVDRTPVVEQSLGASDFGGIAKLAEAMLKLTPSGQEQLLIGAVVFAAIAAVLGGVDTVSGLLTRNLESALSTLAQFERCPAIAQVDERLTDAMKLALGR